MGLFTCQLLVIKAKLCTKQQILVTTRQILRALLLPLEPTVIVRGVEVSLPVKASACVVSDGWPVYSEQASEIELFFLVSEQIEDTCGCGEEESRAGDETAG